MGTMEWLGPNGANNHINHSVTVDGKPRGDFLSDSSALIMVWSHYHYDVVVHKKNKVYVGANKHNNASHDVFDLFYDLIFHNISQ